jgi:hypothetical protein
MIINPGVENIELRCKDEFTYLLRKYPNVAFNVSNWVTGINSRSRGYNILLVTEGYVGATENYDVNHIKNYDAFITSNSKFKELHPELNIYTINGVTNWDAYHWLEDFLTYDEKIRGICSLQRFYQYHKEGEINHLKHEVMRDLNTEPHLILHTYGPVPFGKEGSYQGTVGLKHHSHYDNLKKINEYLFCWCPESCYHPLWSYGHVTERMFNCFKSKTVPIYYGCYNIEDLVPTDLFVDFREFENLDGLAAFLIGLSKDKERYTRMVEDAYEWNLTNKIGDIRELERIIQKCIKDVGKGETK